MTSLRRLPLCALVTVLLSSTSLFAQQAAPAVRITAPIDASQLVTLKGSVHPLANPQNDRGPASAGMQLERLHLILKRSPAQESALRQLIQDQNTPGSANYHQWLTPAQFAAQFGPSAEDLATVENWLSDQGFTVNKIEPGSQALDISGTVGLLQSAFHTQIRKYMVNGELHYANSTDPQIPAALAPVIGGFVSLNNFRYHHYAQQLGEATYDPSTGRAMPSWTIGGGSFDYQKYNFVLSPADYAVQYDLPANLKGDGQTIAIVNESNINVYLVNQFRSLFGLPANPPQIIIDGNDPGIDGINNADGPNGASVEAYLDVEWAGAVAPNATIDLVVASDTSLETGLALAAEHAVYSNVAPVISVSFGGCELFQGSSNDFWNKLWEQAAAQGQTVVVSTGDSGSAGCDSSGAQFATHGLGVNGLASTPWNIAVGGTDFFYTSWNSGNSTTIDNELNTYWNTTASNSSPSVSLLKSVPEQPWNSSQYGLDLFNSYTGSGGMSTTVGAGSGGASSAAICGGTYSGNFSPTNGFCSVKPTGYPKPAWQTGTGVPNDNVRDLPDVSLFAANGYNDSYYPICATDADCQPASAGSTVQIFGVGGTSAAAPAFAGIMALVNQKYGRQGQANTILYPLKTQFPAAFHDISHGTNSVPCEILPTASINCITVTNPAVVQDSSSGVTVNITEGQIGTGTTAAYNAAAGYNLATGLGSVDAATLINDWGSVALATSAVTLNATPTTVTHGSPVAVNGAVTGSGTPTGSVAIMSDSTEPSQQGQSSFALDSSGKYNGSLSTLPGGSYNIWASYSGDAKNGGHVSTKIPITVSPEDSGIAFGLFQDTNIYSSSGSYLTSNITTSVDYGTQLALSARVAPKADVATVQTCTTSSTTACPAYTAPTGTIAFKDNGSTINTAVLNTEGDAEYNAPFSVGSHSVSASYNGDQSYNASTSTPSAITFTVIKDTPQILGATTITDQSGNLVSGTGQQTILTLIIENNAQAKANSNSSISAEFPVPVAAPTGTITLSSSTIPGVSSGSQFTLSPGVDPSNGAQAAVATVVVPANTAAGTYSVTVSYSGDSNYNAIAGSSTTTFQIPIVNFNGLGGLASTTTASAPSGVISPSTTVTISGTVTGQSGHPAPTGSIYLYSSGSYPTSAKLVPGNSDVSSFNFTVTSQTLLQGANELTVQYVGDSVYNPSAYVFSTALSNPLSDFTIVPQSAIVPVTIGGSASDTVELASLNNFTGPVTLTCTAPTGVTCTISSPVTLSAGGSGTSTATLGVSGKAAAQNYNVLITAEDSTHEYIHTVGFTVAAGAPSLNLTNAGTINIATAGSSGTSVFTATPINGFTGTLSLTCAVTGTPSGASTSITCGASNLSATSLNITSSTAQTSTLTINTTSATTTGNYQVTVTGTSGSLTATSEVGVAVAAPPPADFAVSNGGNITVTRGATSNNTSMITVQSKNSFNSAVSLTCSISPIAASDPATCGFDKTSITPAANGTATATLTITTTAATTAMNDQKPVFWSTAGGGLALACALFFWIPKKRRSWLAMFVLLVFLASMAGMACGGGGGNGGGGGGGGGGNPGTTPGTYTVTVTGTAGSLSHNTTVSLTVQ